MKVRKDWMAPGLALALAAMFTVGSLATPAGAHLGDFAHLKKHFYTKKKARATFLENTISVVAREDVAPATTGEVDALCPAGYQALGGGYNNASNTNPGAGWMIFWDEPLIEGDNVSAASDGINGPATGWRVRVRNDTAGTHTLAVGVTCAK